ncbi:DUF2202 domain-containing protein [uncultured Algoriphagus sp.]|jgi:hypothetical protein|uniref:DUF2202 domain-containing protein n=1 Tax=uncultured Algoriphagus sp. TaxID=417365 RepID=UPI0010656854|nr:DUF2202 domain-containing protein [uncultured Algoriphagus sp.]
MKKLLYALGFLILPIGGCQEEINPAVKTSLSEAELSDLLFTREEEKLAHDVYTYAFEKYGVSIFQNISRSETQHINSVLQVMGAYQLSDPLDGSISLGEFTNTSLQNLYSELTSKVDISLEEATKVGLLIEDMDILDLQLAIASTQKPELIQLYEKLKCGSENHMRAFYNQATTLGVTYNPSYITIEEFDRIVNSSNTTCQPN